MPKVLGNHIKGDPPFKPQKGNFGRISWFAGSGNPYVGGQAQSYDVAVDVDITPDPVALAPNYFHLFKTDYVNRTHANLRNNSTHHDFWVALGKSLENQGAAEVRIDQSEVSAQGGGTFLVVGASARGSIRLTDPVKLEKDLGGAGVSMETRRKLLAAREGIRQPGFKVLFVSVKHSVAGAKSPIVALSGFIAQPTTWSLEETRAFPAIQRLMGAIKAGAFASYGTVNVIPGTRWSGKEVKAYTS